MWIFDVFHHPRAGHVLLRWSLGVLLLFHGAAKITGGVGFIEGLLAKAGMPALLAWGSYVGEVVAPLLLLANRLVVPAALVIVVQMLFAIGLVHLGELAQRNDGGGWALELQAFYVVTAIVVALTAERSR